MLALRRATLSASVASRVACRMGAAAPASMRHFSAGPSLLEDEDIQPIRDAVKQLCGDFPGEYWREKDAASAYPSEFVKAMTDSGFLSILVPEQYGGSGQPIKAASAVLEEVHRSGCNGGALHAQMYTMGSILKFGTDAQKEQFLPGIAAGELRLQAFGVSEPNNGTDTLSLDTTATPDGDSHFLINGQKMWTSRAMHSDLMLVLARTGGPESKTDPKLRSKGLSLFIVDMREAVGNGMTITPVETMMNHSTTQVFFENVRVPAENMIGSMGDGLKCVLGSLNAERILIASESIGDGKYFLDKAVAYANERKVFGRPIGQNQGIAFPIAKAYANVKAADLMVHKAAAMYDQGLNSGEEANIAKHLAAESAWEAGEVCMQTHGGFAFAKEYDIERKWREARLYRIAPISTNLIYSYIAEKVLGMPRSY